MLRFYFWQPIEYLNPKPKFPDWKWQKGRFVSIAWDHRSRFTYLIWTEPDKGGWKKGRELVRNVVRPWDKSGNASTVVTKEEHEHLKLICNKNVLSQGETMALTKK
eukprot:5233138-Ditylum_brightwellii.AAC.3